MWLRNTKEWSITYRQSETCGQKIPQKRTTTACFIQEESSDSGCSGMFLRYFKYNSYDDSTNSTRHLHY